MSAIVQEFVEALDAKVKGIIRGTAKLVIKDEGTVFLSETGATAEDKEADVTMIASDIVFRNILSGDQNPAMAVMSGKLKVDGNPMRALKVSDILTA